MRSAAATKSEVPHSRAGLRELVERARPVQSAEKVGSASRSRSPGTCEAVGAALSSTRLVSLVNPWRPFGCARPRDGSRRPSAARTIDLVAEQIASAAARESSPVPVLPAIYMRCGGPGSGVPRPSPSPRARRLKTLLVHQPYWASSELVGEFPDGHGSFDASCLRAGAASTNFST